MVGEGNRHIAWPPRVAGGVVQLFWCWFSQMQVFEEKTDDAQGMAAVWTIKRIDFVDLLNGPGPVGF